MSILYTFLSMCKAALHSTLFSYTPLVISEDWQKYATNIFKAKVSSH